MRALYVAGTLLIAGSIAATGCGGGGSSNPRGNGSSNTSSKSAQYTVKIKIPTASGSSSNAVRRAKYVSPAVQSIVVQIFNGTTQVVQGSNYVNVTANGSSGAGSCTTVSSVTTCTVAVNATISSAGSYTVVVATYDAAQNATCAPSSTPACSGNLLSISDLPQDVTPGGTINVTLGGIPAYLQGAELVSGYMIAHNNAITLYGPGPQKIAFEFLDADQNVIIGTGAPAVSVTSGTPSVLSASITSNGSGLYTLTYTPQTVASPAGPVVQPGPATVIFTLAVPNTTLTASATQTVTLAHSAVYVSANAPSPPGTLSIYAYFDGNSQPSWNVYDTGSPFLNIATDISGDIWAADLYNNKIAVWLNPQPGSAPSENDPAPGPGNFGYPWDIAFDLSGNAFVGNCPECDLVGGNYSLIQYNAPSPQNTPNFTSTAFTYYSDVMTQPEAIAVDANDNIYPTVMTTPAANGLLYKYNAGSSTLTALVGPNGNTYTGAAIDPLHGNVWILSTGTVSEVSSSTGLQVGSSNSALFDGALGLATDSLGNVYVALTSGNGIAFLQAPTFALTTTIGTLTNPVSVAVYPNSLIGQYSPVGVTPSQLPSPIPLPTPS